MKHLSHSESDTATIAKNLAKDITHQDVIFLQGNLGAGKTVFARALIQTLCDNQSLEVISPTFTLVQSYDGKSAAIDHYDLYRIEDPDEIPELGWEDSLANGITLIEWPERLGPYKPTSYLDIHIRNVDNQENTREILIERKE